MLTRARVYDVLFVLLGVLALVAKKQVAWSCCDMVQNYGGNVAGSFAAFFLFKFPVLPSRFRIAGAAALALLAAESFEATNGFGFMSNTYDPGDYLANAVGVGLAVGVQWIVFVIPRLRPRESGHS